MKKEKLTSVNIDNLTALFEALAQPFDGVDHQEDFTLAFIPNSNIPNRVWAKNELITKDRLLQIYQLAKKENTPIIYPVLSEKANELIDKKKWDNTFNQTAMYLDLQEHPVSYSDALKIKIVNNKEAAKLFAETASLAFGYHVPSTIVEASMEHKQIEFYVAYENSTPVATGILATFHEVAGIHMVGVPPQARRKGYAHKMMNFLLDNAIQKGLKISTLQASDAGKPLYTKMGYKTQFIISNFVSQL